MNKNTTASAHIRFLTGWRTIQEGTITRGGKLIVDYDPERLPDLRRWWRDALIWNMEAVVRFHPGGQQHRESVLQEIRANPNSGPVIGYSPRTLVLDVPEDATQVEMWFRSWWDLWQFSEVWDSKFGQNYWFDVIL